MKTSQLAYSESIFTKSTEFANFHPKICKLNVPDPVEVIGIAYNNKGHIKTVKNKMHLSNHRLVKYTKFPQNDFSSRLFRSQ